MSRKSLQRRLAEELDDILFGYPRSRRRGAPSLREIAVNTRRRWAGDLRGRGPGRFHEADLIIPLRVYGMCSFQLERLKARGGDVRRRRAELHRAATAIRALRAMDPGAYDRVLGRWCRHAFDNHRRAMTSFRRVLGPRGFRGRQPWQFVIQVLFPREGEDYTFRAIRELSFPLDAEGLAVRYAAIEDANRETIRKAARWYGANFWRWIDRPELFMEEHWWRGVIYDAYRRKRARGRRV